MNQVLSLTAAVEKLQQTVSANQTLTPQQDIKVINNQQQQIQLLISHPSPPKEKDIVKKKIDAPTQHYPDDDASLSDSSTVIVKLSDSKRTQQKPIPSTDKDNPFIIVKNKTTKTKNSKKQKTSNDMDDDNP